MSLDRYLAGDDSARDAAIVECQPLVDEVVKAFSERKGFQYLAEDLQSEGYLRLVTLIPEMQCLKFDDPTKYIRRVIDKLITEFVTKDISLGMSHRSWRRRRDDGESVSTSHADSEHIERLCSAGARAQGRANETREALYDLCKTSDERMVVDMRERGFDYREIASELGMSLDTVHKTLKSLQERLEAELQEA